jgi:UDP-galactopyranose mutase
MNIDILVVGAGFAGAVSARTMAEKGRKVLLIEKRPHIGGNAFDKFDEYGILIHPYGPHIFHTNSKRIIEWLSRFTEWRFYEHRVLAQVNQQLLPIPINITTLKKLYGVDFDEQGAKEWLDRSKIAINEIKTSEDVVLSSVGHDLCEKFYRGYTKKQWGLDLSELSASVASRIPTRTNNDDRYFTDTYQFMPTYGYSALFSKILDHPNIKIKLNTDYFLLKKEIKARHTIYTGPIDLYFNNKFGRLPYRSIDFQHEHIGSKEKIQTVGTINYPNDHDFTRITEFKHLTGQIHAGTSIVKEYPNSTGDPYYPIPRHENEILYKKYVDLSESIDDVTFVGRLAQYQYLNMDQVVASALKACDCIKN